MEHLLRLASVVEFSELAHKVLNVWKYLKI